jgi:hypothetical protein
MSTKWRDRRSFGPGVIHEPDGSFRPICTWCVFRVGDTCTHVKPSRRLADPENTPIWCEMRADMIRDAKEMVGK